MKASRGFTGWHMLLATSAFFAVVIAVNVTMAVYASSSWSGLVVENTYVASQEFNGKAAAMKAMAASGIEGALSLNGSEIRYDIHEQGGAPAIIDKVTLNFKRPVGDHEDFSLALRKTGEGRFEADHEVAGGDWIVEAISRRNGVVVMHEAKRFDTAEFGQ
ncbi:nitrogen fixation protein FixH 1 (plasmid) [Rhizobium phaseoli]|uniref:FixH family protein n=1 Tax=Rhizobium phaseoli TaxID=396 RepID=UPI0007EBE241|nr:FixH family protein [Rhizobium phaseoli]ANL36516.1 nitrogen fixation protein FixH 1 [Rhizobium phaseoli]ANL67997.1 nitrogen fixation protein FixH 1 [Rhizobium phaseoli]ANL80811.1 nitrogen fixation protein FixH 1 [Rhizobium phaseoli]ANM00241.1 nitrogen fixation protein FixH 1 [Rhizobium phaseoli]ANM06632.1 nitrogen fixation protein FixH 1 [Rhizobium phaseoli]